MIVFGTAFALLFFRKWFALEIALNCVKSERNRDEAVPSLLAFVGRLGRYYTELIISETGRNHYWLRPVLFCVIHNCTLINCDTPI